MYMKYFLFIKRYIIPQNKKTNEILCRTPVHLILSKSKDGRCYYCPILDDQAGIINDPVVLRLNEKRWWISIADTDVILFAKGLAIGNKFDVLTGKINIGCTVVEKPFYDPKKKIASS